MKKGMVYLVGAGPGDPGLFTIKGKQVLEKAQVVVYDRLVNDRILSFAPEDAKMVYVGKISGGHAIKQEEINKTLVEHALAGYTVVRLKGGDPFLFGRGGEEALYIKEHGIDFEIVPGVTSAVAVPAYAGIPVTHRDNNSSLSIITGHEKPEKLESSIDWSGLAQGGSTLVFLMGVENLNFICTQLMAKGKAKDTPVALIRWGTWPEQTVIAGRLDNIVQLTEESNFQPPAVIVIGEVVKWRDKLAWLEHKPLWGLKIVVTRARAQASQLTEIIYALGGASIEFPTIEITRDPDLSHLHKTFREIEKFHWIIFTSVNGVEIFFDELKKCGLDIRCLNGIKLAAIGPATKAKLESMGLLVHLMPGEYKAEGMLAELSQRIASGEQVLLPRARGARALLPDSLRDQGVTVTEIPLYQATPTGKLNQKALPDIKAGEFDYLTFTSSSTVDNFVAMAGHEVIPLLNRRVRIACIGPITADTAGKYGFDVHICAARYTIEGLVEAIIEDNKNFRREAH